MSLRTVLRPARAEGDGGGLLFCSDTGKLLYLPPPVFTAIAAGDLAGIGPAARDRLSRAGAFAEGPSDDNRDYCALTRDSLAASEVLYVVVFVASKCQLGCSYCGQTHDDSFDAGAMLEPTFERIRRSLDARRGVVKELIVGWFGGEPLMGLSYMQELGRRLSDLCAARGVGLRSKMATNGLGLTRAAAKILCEDCRCRELDITLDGPPPVHDRRRLLKSGGPSFDHILRNVVAFTNDRELDGCRITIRSNLDAANARYAFDLVDLLAAEGLARKVDLYFAPVRSWGNYESVAAALIDKQRYAEADLALLKHLRLRGFSTRFLPAPKRGACLTVNPASEVIGPDGQVYKCTEHPLVKSYGPEVKLGGVADAAPLAGLPGYTDWLALVEDGRVPCSRCEMFSVCGGSCPKAWNEGEIPCPSPKFNIEGRMHEVYEMNRTSVGEARRSGSVVELQERRPVVTIAP